MKKFAATLALALVATGCGFSTLGSDGGAPPDLAGSDGGGGGSPDLFQPLTWHSEPMIAGTTLTGVWGSNPSDVYVSGNAGLISHSAGDGNWTTPLPTGTAYDLARVWGSNGTLVAVGQNATVVTLTSGNLWNTRNPQTPSYLLGVWGTGSYFVAGGLNGDITTSINGGVDWTAITFNGGAWRRVWGLTADENYATGDFGYIAHKNAGTWGAPASIGNLTVLGVWGATHDDVYVVASTGKIFHSTGADDWQPQTSGVTNDLYGIWGSGPHDLYAVGQGEIILHSTGDGQWWTIYDPKLPGQLVDIWGSGPDNIYAVGGSTILHGKLQ
jgi:hypothetical protein